jgi:acetyl esterase/lipase
MRYERIPLSEKNPEVFLDVYVADPVKALTRKVMLVLPGGGYKKICANREGEPVAMAFLPYGFNCFVLHYTVNCQDPFPIQLIEVARAIKHIKDHAEEYCIDPEAIFITGFSAGGHLAASAGILWKLPAIYEAVDMPYGYNKPKGVIPIYPVISAWGGHEGSFWNLWCTETPTREQLEQVSLEMQVDEDSVPAFIIHSPHDKTAPIKNSLLLAMAYSEVGIPYEMHIYPKIPHAAGLGNEITAHGRLDKIDQTYADWVRLAANWTKTL